MIWVPLEWELNCFFLQRRVLVNIRLVKRKLIVNSLWGLSGRIFIERWVCCMCHVSDKTLKCNHPLFQLVCYWWIYQNLANSWIIHKWILTGTAPSPYTFVLPICAVTKTIEYYVPWMIQDRTEVFKDTELHELWSVLYLWPFVTRCITQYLVNNTETKKKTWQLITYNKYTSIWYRSVAAVNG